MSLLRSTAIALCVAGQLEADAFTCAGSVFEVSGSDAATRARACNAAAEAHAQLASCGVVIDWPVKIFIVERIENQPPTCLGLYHCGNERIEILSPTAMSAVRSEQGVFALVSDTSFWNSILAHELTHAAFDKVDCPISSCIATAEYAAFAMQVYTLPKDQQALFGVNFSLMGDPSWEAISPIFLFLSPDHFAMNAWLHFQNRDAPCDFMQLIMDGEIFFDREPH